MATVNYQDPVRDIRGTFRKGGIINRRKTASQSTDCSRIYLRDLHSITRTTPLKPKEVTIRQRFQAVRAMVAARKEDLTKVTQDQLDFLAQKDLANGKKTMNAYLWLVCGREYDESQD